MEMQADLMPTERQLAVESGIDLCIRRKEEKGAFLPVLFEDITVSAGALYPAHGIVDISLGRFAVDGKIDPKFRL